MRPCLRAVLSVLLLAAPVASAGPVVINEIFYHPPDDQDRYQWVELHNPGADEVDLGGWKFSKGLDLELPEGTRLAAGGYGVVVRDRAAFGTRYGAAVPVLAEFKGKLKKGGERLELVDRAGTVSDAVRFGDRDPWPLAPDGSGASLERVRAVDPGDLPSNWAPSAWGGRQPGGTPGRENGAVRAVAPPGFSEVKFEPWIRGGSNLVQVRIGGATVPVSVTARVLAVGPAGAERERAVPMQGKAGTWTVALPAVSDQRVVRFWFEAKDGAGNLFRWPSTNEIRPAFSYLAWKEPVAGTIPQLHVWDGGKLETPGQVERFGPQRRTTPGAGKPRGGATVVYVPAAGAPGGVKPEMRDFVRAGLRKGGWKVRFQKDAALDGMRTVNVVFEDKPRYVLAEHLSYELFRRSKVMTPKSDIVRWVHNGESAGYHLMVEQPGSGFLARHQRDPAGNLYKLLWYGNGLVGQHEKKNNPGTGHADLQAAVQGLGGRSGNVGEFIRQHFDVERCVDYFVVSQCLQNWDGYFNNYFVFHGPGAGGRWEFIPWDEDKTWGDYDGASARYDWYTMPLTYGMKGDRPPGGGGGGWQTGGFGPGMWWRPGGWFSAPMLAEPGFRAQFLKRMREFVETEFTEARFGPVIDSLARRLEPEVRHRAEVRGSTEESLLREFRNDIASFRGQLKGRHDFLARELAK